MSFQGDEKKAIPEGVNSLADNLREELADMSFAELQTLKSKIGIKKFNEALRTVRVSSQQSHKPESKSKRDNKNRPMEVSSKKPISRFRCTSSKSKKISRDPRFDDLSGDYNEAIFENTYGFLNNIKNSELEKIRKKMKKEKDPAKQKELQSLVTRLQHQEDLKKLKEQKRAKEKQLQQKERQLINQGKKPFYLKKSEKKKLELADKFRELKRSGKIESYLSKKRKKNATKERKKLPQQKT